MLQLTRERVLNLRQTHHSHFLLEGRLPRSSPVSSFFLEGASAQVVLIQAVLPASKFKPKGCFQRNLLTSNGPRHRPCAMIVSGPKQGKYVASRIESAIAAFEMNFGIPEEM